MRDELPEDLDAQLSKLGRRISWGTFFLGFVSTMLYVLMRGKP
jgi:hypothetical protein